MNQEWSLERFVDSLVIELDQARETLAVKSINRPLSYTVKDLSLDLQIFPSYEDGNVRFVTARPGQQGASKITLQLASITDQQVRATSKPPPGRNDLRLEATELDSRTQQELRRLGVTRVSDLEQIEEKNVDLESATRGAVDYSKLANLIQKARRGSRPPRVHAASLEPSAEGALLWIEGENLGVSPDHTPVAVVDDRLGEVVDHGPGHVCVRLDPGQAARPETNLILTLDPYCLVRMRLESGEVVR